MHPNPNKRLSSKPKVLVDDDDDTIQTFPQNSSRKEGTVKKKRTSDATDPTRRCNSTVQPFDDDFYDEEKEHAHPQKNKKLKVTTTYTGDIRDEVPDDENDDFTSSPVTSPVSSPLPASSSSSFRTSRSHLLPSSFGSSSSSSSSKPRYSMQKEGVIPDTGGNNEEPTEKLTSGHRKVIIQAFPPDHLDPRLHKKIKIEEEKWMHNWNILKEIVQPFDPEIVRKKPGSFKRKCKKMLTALEAMWYVENAHDLYELRRVAIRNMSLGRNVTANEIPTPEEVELAIDRNVVHITLQLKLRFSLANLIGNEDHLRSTEFEDRFINLFTIQLRICEGFYNIIIAQRMLEGKCKVGSSCLNLMRFMPRSFDKNSLNNFQKFFIYCLEEMQKRQYRKDGEWVMIPIFNKKKQFTNAWKRKEEISKFVNSLAGNPDLRNEQFLAAWTNGKIVDQVSKSLRDIRTDYFPEIEMSRFLVSFNNGVYCFTDDRFYPFAEPEYDDEVTSEDIKRGLNLSGVENDRELLRRSMQREEDEKQAKEQKATTIGKKNTAGTATLEDDENPDDGIPGDTTSLPTPKKSVYDDENLPSVLSTKLVSCKYFDREFRIAQKLITTDDGEEKLVTVDDWREIETPAWESVLVAQKFPTDVIEKAYELWGRGLYSGQDRDNWQLAVFVKGAAGTGKSTLLKSLRDVYPMEKIGFLSNNIEKQWALSTLYNKFTVFGMEIKKDFKWDQGEFQNCVSCEEVLVAQKHLTAFAHQFSSHIFMAGNEMVETWRDTSGSLRRRIVFFDFRHPISERNSNPRLYQEMEKEFDLWLQKINKAYRELSDKFGTQDLWNVMPEYFKKVRDDLLKDLHPIHWFLAENGHLLTFGPDEYCQAKDFQALMKKTMEEFDKLLEKGINILQTSVSAYVFSQFGITVHKPDEIDQSVKAKYWKGRKGEPTHWLKGVSIVEHSIQSDITDAGIDNNIGNFGTAGPRGYDPSPSRSRSAMDRKRLPHD